MTNRDKSTHVTMTKLDENCKYQQVDVCVLIQMMEFFMYREWNYGIYGALHYVCVHFFCKNEGHFQ